MRRSPIALFLNAIALVAASALPLAAQQMRIRSITPIDTTSAASTVADALADTSTADPKSTAPILPKGKTEFTRQGLLIMNFEPGSGANARLGKRAADAVRSRVDKYVNKREVEVVDGSDIALKMTNAGFLADTNYAVETIHSVAVFFRSDEYIVARVSSTPTSVRMWGDLVLIRDRRLRQPILAATAPKMDSAATLFAKNIVAARAQLVPQRRCENALRDRDGKRAVAAAREGVSLYSRSTIARTCLIWAMRTVQTPATEVLNVAQEVLKTDSNSYFALEAAAVALDSLRRRDEAAKMYLRLASVDTANVELAVRVIYSLLDIERAKIAEPFIVKMVESHPEELRLLQQLWTAAYENKNWALATKSGEDLFKRDSVVPSDPSFHIRMSNAYKSSSRPYDAVRTLANAVKTFPKDQRVYSMYTQSIKAEADTVIPRGLALFPASADLLAMNGKELRAKGKIAESLDATKRAVEIDSTMAQGRMVIAQLELELGRPDSALSTLRRAVSSGEDVNMVAQFALGKGNQFYRAASATKTRNDFELAYRFLAFADTVKSSVQSKFLVGAAALGIAQTVLTESSTLKDKLESCPLVKRGIDMIAIAQTGLTAGLETFGESATQSLYFLTQLEPYAAAQLKSQCEQPMLH